jgi:hypothetical protein
LYPLFVGHRFSFPEKAISYRVTEIGRPQLRLYQRSAMNSSATPQPDRYKPTPDGPQAMPSKEVLEQVLRQTLADADLADGANASDLSALIEVARRHPGAAHPTTRIVCELVGTLLESRFPRLQVTLQFRETVALEIASTLMDDPYQRDLLDRFWSKLSDKAA